MGLTASVAQEMGVTLQRAAFSPNIKLRRDFSCGIFDAQGRLLSQAAHIPVHLGAMPAAVRAVTRTLTLDPGDLVIFNDPYLGGTHLPDITMLSPVYTPPEEGATLQGYLVSRAHHADVGGMTPGSMPLSREIFQEGLIIPPLKLVSRGVRNDALLALICRNVRTPDERLGDLRAQMAAHEVGAQRMREVAAGYGAPAFAEHVEAALTYGETMMRHALARLRPGTYSFADCLDGDGVGMDEVWIRATVRVSGTGTLEVDFSGSDDERPGCINAVAAVAESATYYAVRCLADPAATLPLNEGVLRPITVRTREGSVVAARAPRAVAGGNVETSQRIVDVVFGALAPLLPEVVPAASQGTMNNLTFGGLDPRTGLPFAYYETIGGGMGARPSGDGESGVHDHMSNTLNTPIEALELAYPVRLRAYHLREGSGGAGRYRGGEGVVREIEFLAHATVTLIADRRRHAPYGLSGGAPGASGADTLTRRGGPRNALPSKATIEVEAGDIIRIETPGGGGHGKALDAIP